MLLRFILFIPLFLFAKEPIQPLPKHIQVNVQKASLGEKLFHDSSLSLDGTVSCATCHSLKNYGVDGLPVSIGVKGRKGIMNALSVYNARFNYRQFWNGRAKTLQDQALSPLTTHFEMGLTEQEIIRRINASSTYQKEFKQIYDTAPITLDQIGDAIAEFERMLVTPESRFDRYLNGEATLSDKELEGYVKFKEFGCVICHHGINIGGNSYQQIGVAYPYPWDKKTQDLYARTGKPEDKNKYRVPSLRNVTRTAPYFHDGAVPTLRAAIQLMAYHNLGLQLSEPDIDSIEAFFGTLEGHLPKRYQ